MALNFTELRALFIEKLLNSTKVPAAELNNVVDQLITTCEFEVGNFTENFKGTATTSTNPGTPTSKVWYLASGPGTYTHFGGTVVAQEFATLTWNGSAWVLYEIDITVDMTLYAKKTMDADLNANTHKITNLSNATNDGDAINKGQLSTLLGTIKYGYNLYKHGVSEVYAGYINGNGSFSLNASWLTIINIPVKPSTWYCFYATGGCSNMTVANYSALPEGQPTFLATSTVTVITDGAKFQTHASAAYVGIIVSDAAPFVTDLTTLVIREGDTNVGWVSSNKSFDLKTQLEDIILKKSTVDGDILYFDSASQLVKTKTEYRPPKIYYRNLYVNGVTTVYAGYISVGGGLALLAGYATIINIAAKPSTWYSIYATGGLSIGVAACYSALPIGAGTYLNLPTMTAITDGYKFQTHASTAYIAIIVNDSTPFVTDMASLTLVEGEANIGIIAPVKVLNSSDSEGWKTKLSDISVPTTAQNQQLVIYDSSLDSLVMGNEPAEVLTILNSDKILLMGVSSSEGVYEIKNKSFAAKVSSLLDMPIYNRSTSGMRLPQLASRLKTNVAAFNDGGVRTIKPTYIVWGVTANYGSESGVDELHYLEEIFHTIEAGNGLGAISIFRSDIIGNLSLDVTFYKLAQKNNLLYVSNLNADDVICKSGTGFAGFWAGGHAGARTNEHQFYELLRMLETLPVRKSIKIFKVRSAYKSGSPLYSDLNYDSNLGRLKYFYEISSGTKGLHETTPATGVYLYDRINETTYAESFNDDYSNMKNGTNVAFSGFALLEFVLSKTGLTSFVISVKMDVEPTAVYLSNTNDTNKAIATDINNAAFKVSKAIYDAFSESVGEVFTCPLYSGNLTYAGKLKNYALPGYWLFFNAAEQCKDGSSGTLTKTSGGATTAYLEASARYASYDFTFYQLYNTPKSTFESVSYSYNATTDILLITVTTPEKYMRFDKVKMLISKSGTFNLTTPSIAYSGGYTKATILKDFVPKPAYNELQTYVGFDANWITSGLWVNNGATLEAHSGAIQSYPNIHSKDNHIILDFDATDGFPQSISKSFSIVESTAYRKVIVRVLARLYPKIFDTTKTPDANYTNVQQLTKDSYDYGTLICSFKFGSLPAGLMKELVDVGWAEITFESVIPPYQTSFEIMLYRDPYDNIDPNYKNYGWPLHVYNVSVQVED